MTVFHLLIPNKNKKKRSYALQYQVLASYVFFIFALIISSYLVVSSFPNILGYATDINSRELLKHTNSIRVDAGLNALVINNDLSKAAQAKANDMFQDDYWAHTAPDGTEPWDFIVTAGYDYLYAGENLAVDFSHSKSVVDAWYESPSHKANLINNKYSEVGFAVVNGELEGRDTTLIVQMFGHPRRQIAKITPESQVAIEIDKPVEIENVAGESVVPEIQQTVAESSNEIVPSVITTAEETGSVLNSSDVFNVSKYLAITLGLFLSIMFAVDGYYVRKYGVLRISGHTILHILILAIAVAGIWYTSIGLVL